MIAHMLTAFIKQPSFDGQDTADDKAMCQLRTLCLHPLDHAGADDMALRKENAEYPVPATAVRSRREGWPTRSDATNQPVKFAK